MDTNSKIITYIKCQRCGEEWVEEAHELFCPKCMEDAEADLACSAIFTSIRRAEQCTPLALSKRLDILGHSLAYLKSLIEVIKNNSGK